MHLFMELLSSWLNSKELPWYNPLSISSLDEFHEICFDKNPLCLTNLFHITSPIFIKTVGKLVLEALSKLLSNKLSYLIFSTARVMTFTIFSSHLPFFTVSSGESFSLKCWNCVSYAPNSLKPLIIPYRRWAGEEDIPTFTTVYCGRGSSRRPLRVRLGILVREGRAYEVRERSEEGCGAKICPWNLACDCTGTCGTTSGPTELEMTHKTG